MHLKSIQIRGFKSFAENTEVHLKEGINIIVGPNGCGKSNIVDAIRWVIGEGNVRNLRGVKNEDVIFNGSDKKRALGMANVNICIDNSERNFDIDYNELLIGRKIFRSGESEFYINQSKVRMKDLQALFTGTGLGKRGYSIIGQGELEQVLNGQAIDRRLILEEASGIIKYRQEREEAKKRMELNAQDLSRLWDILQDLEQRKIELENKAEKAKHYLELSKESQEIEKRLHRFEIHKQREDLENKKIQASKIQEEIEVLKNQTKGIHEQLNLHQKNLEKNTNLLSELRQENYIIDSQRQNAHNEWKIAQERIKNYNERLINVENDEKKNQKSLDKLEQDWLISVEDFTLENKDYQSKQEAKEETRLAIEDLEKFLNAAEVEFNKKKNLLYEKTRQEAEIRNSLAEQEEQVKKANDKKERIIIHYKELNERIKKQNNNLAENQIALSQTVEEINNQDLLLEDILKVEKQLSQEIKQRDEEYHAIYQESLKIESKIKAFKETEKNFYSSGVRAVIEANKRQELNGIIGVIADLIKVPEGLEHAIEIAAANALQNIVVKEALAAEKAINYLKIKSLGRATFLPQEILRVQVIPPKILLEIKQKEGILGLASELLKYHQDYQKAIDYVFSRILIVRSLRAGKDIFNSVKYPFRIVSVDGEIINPSGAISGGREQNRRHSILERKAEINKFQALLEKQKSSLLSIKEKGEKLRDEYIIIESKLAERKNLYNEAKFKKQILINEIEAINKEIKQLKSEEEQHIADLDAFEHNILIFKNKLLDLGKKLDDIQEENININAHLEKQKNFINEKKQEYEVKKERYLSQEEQVKMKEKEMEKARKNMEQYLEMKHSYQVSISELKLEKENLSKYIIKEIELSEEYLVKFQKLEKESFELRQKCINTEEKIKLNTMEYEAQKKLFLPLNEKMIQKEEMIRNSEIKIVKSESELESIETRWLEKFNIAYNQFQLIVLSSKESREYNKRIEDLRELIIGLEPVDLTSIEEYKQIKEKHDFMEQQFQDMIETQKSMKKLLDETEKLMHRDFMSFYSKARESFQEIFIEIFGGGEADIILDSKDEKLESGIEIIVKMPGKKSQSLNLLSGGERALTCIAFIFSLMRLKPVPFCLLDEIDASLDETNLMRFGRFLKKMSQEIQFLIITHRQTTIESGKMLYGVTMPEEGVSTVFSINLDEAQYLAG